MVDESAGGSTLNHRLKARIRVKDPLLIRAPDKCQVPTLLRGNLPPSHHYLQPLPRGTVGTSNGNDGEYRVTNLPAWKAEVLTLERD